MKLFDDQGIYLQEFWFYRKEKNEFEGHKEQYKVHQEIGSHKVKFKAFSTHESIATAWELSI